ncbi:MAG: NAD(P)H-dependent oxidoreductase [Actinobacteria bacterium]|nr:NAD(P)H-dependent oxidoreductase [Actinomycetota bacterium]
MRVLAICGSLRRSSHNRKLLQAAARELPNDVAFELFQGLGDLPHYDEDADVELAHPAVRRLRDALARADAVLIATPEYNASLPGALKNALDWASRPFPDNCLRDMPVAVIGASTSLFGAIWAQAELRKVLTAIGARVIERELPVPRAHEAFEATGASARFRSRGSGMRCRHSRRGARSGYGCWRRTACKT